MQQSKEYKSILEVFQELKNNDMKDQSNVSLKNCKLFAVILDATRPFKT